MDKNLKSDKLKDNILKDSVQRYFETLINELLYICESEIEKQLLLHFLKYIFNDIFFSGPYPFSKHLFGNSENYNYWRIISIIQIWKKEEWIGMSKQEIEKHLSQGYKFHGSDLVKSIGIEFKDECEYDQSFTKYQLIPQYKVVSTNLYRLDFALLSFHYINNEIVKESKVAIECDGYEFHSTQKKFTEDKKRDRELQKGEWKIYRMSGSEIFGITTYKKLEDVLNDLRKLTK